MNEPLTETQVAAIGSNVNMPPLANDAHDPVIITDKTIFAAKGNEPEARHQTFGYLFDLLKVRGYKSLPKNIEIHIPGWN